MNKVLSICIPSYNMEDYLNRCVDSLIADEILDKLEIIIVNDGSKDKTLELANDYKRKYPNSIIVIDKENGHYGSCVNAAFKIATGKYFRILDADDWFDTKALITFVNTIENLEVDVVFNKHAEFHENKKTYKYIDYKFTKYNETFDLATNVLPQKWIFIHCITYRLNLLTEIEYTQTEGICYTDNEFTFLPITKAKKIYLTDIVLVNYFIGRNEQSISIESRKKNVGHFLKVLESIMYSSNEMTNINYNHLKPFYIFDLTENVLLLTLLRTKISKKDIKLLHFCIDYLHQSNYELYNRLMSNLIFKLWYKTPYLFRILLPILKLRYHT